MRRFSFPLVIALLACAFFPYGSASVRADGQKFRYPFDQIADPRCRFSEWSTLGSDCKIALPVIRGADFNKYKDDYLYQRVYTVLWTGTYDYGWDMGKGSHTGIDIATSKGTPVVAIGDGTVVVAASLSGWGNTVSIRHALDDGSYIYSNYSHLSEIAVQKGATVRSGDRIGAVGSTGNSTGNHLHFQIDTTNANHPYYYSACAKGKDEMAVVNQGLCRGDLEKNTVDPVAFLESGRVASPTPSAPVTNETIKDIQEAPKPVIEQSQVKSREEVELRELEDFLKEHTVSVALGAASKNVPLNGSKNGRILVTTVRDNKPFTGNLPFDGIELHTDGPGLVAFPERIIAIEQGGRDFSVTGRSLGAHVMSLRIGPKVLSVTAVTVYDPAKETAPTRASFVSPTGVVLGDERAFAAVMKTTYGSYALDMAYDGQYVVRTYAGRAKFCNVSKKIRKTCATGELVDELRFGYADTVRGALLFDMVALDTSDVRIEIVRASDQHRLVLGNPIKISKPADLGPTTPYGDAIFDALKKGLLRTKQGMTLSERAIQGRQAKEMIDNALGYLWLKAGDDRIRKSRIDSWRKAFAKTAANTGDFQTITRAAFARSVMDAFHDARDTPTAGKPLRDESGDYEPEIRTLRVRDGFAWHDQFGATYFQSDKTITIGEATYFLNAYLEKRLAERQ